MNNKARLSVVITLALGAGIASWRYFHLLSPDSMDPTVRNHHPSGTSAPVPAAPEGTELSALLSDPRVQEYLQREDDKAALDTYFNGDGGGYTDEEIWQLIDTIEREGRVMAYEGLALKLAWLERNSASEAEFDTAAQALMEEYRRNAESSAREYDPYEDVPGFADYKRAEQRIIERVKGMDSFPDGVTRQEFLRQQLQAAREEAYSKNGDRR